MRDRIFHVIYRTNLNGENMGRGGRGVKRCDARFSYHYFKFVPLMMDPRHFFLLQSYSVYCMYRRRRRNIFVSDTESNWVDPLDRFRKASYSNWRVCFLVFQGSIQKSLNALSSSSQHICILLGIGLLSEWAQDWGFHTYHLISLP